MYETKETSVKGIIITILLIILVICVLIWIFPTKKDIKGISSANNEPLLNEIFTNNLKVLQNAGKAYYYTATIPKNVGDSTIVTLERLVSEKMLLALRDKDGKLCDEKNSYAKLTKKTNDTYELKSSLKCGDDNDYIVTTLSCDDFKNKCKTTTTTKNTTTTTNTTTTKTTNTTNTTTTTNTNKTATTTKSVTYTYRYLFTCKNQTSSYTSWSNWSKNAVTSSSNREVETKVEYEKTYQKVGSTQKPVYTEKTVYETQEKTVRSVNYKVEGAKSCQVLPRTGYTIYECVIEEKTPKTVQEITSYETVDQYDYVSTPVTYYRYRDLVTSTSNYQFWTTNYNDSYGKNCDLTSTEKIAQ